MSQQKEEFHTIQRQPSQPNKILLEQLKPSPAVELDHIDDEKLLNHPYFVALLINLELSTDLENQEMILLENLSPEEKQTILSFSPAYWHTFLRIHALWMTLFRELSYSFTSEEQKEILMLYRQFFKQWLNQQSNRKQYNWQPWLDTSQQIYRRIDRRITVQKRSWKQWFVQLFSFQFWFSQNKPDPTYYVEKNLTELEEQLGTLLSAVPLSKPTYHNGPACPSPQSIQSKQVDHQIPSEDVYLLAAIPLRGSKIPKNHVELLNLVRQDPALFKQNLIKWFKQLPPSFQQPALWEKLEHDYKQIQIFLKHLPANQSVEGYFSAKLSYFLPNRISPTKLSQHRSLYQAIAHIKSLEPGGFSSPDPKVFIIKRHALSHKKKAVEEVLLQRYTHHQPDQPQWLTAYHKINLAGNDLINPQEHILESYREAIAGPYYQKLLNTDTLIRTPEIILIPDQSDLSHSQLYSVVLPNFHSLAEADHKQLTKENKLAITRTFAAMLLLGEADQSLQNIGIFGMKIDHGASLSRSFNQPEDMLSYLQGITKQFGMIIDKDEFAQQLTACLEILKPLLESEKQAIKLPFEIPDLKMTVFRSEDRYETETIDLKKYISLLEKNCATADALLKYIAANPKCFQSPPLSSGASKIHASQ